MASSSDESTAPNSPGLAEGEYFVERIIDRQKENGQYKYLVAWRGYPGEDTWEPVENLANCPALVQAMDEQKDAEEAKAKQKSKKTPRRAVGYVYEGETSKSMVNLTGDFYEQLRREEVGRSLSKERPASSERPASKERSVSLERPSSRDRSVSKERSMSKERPATAKKPSGQEFVGIKMKKSDGAAAKSVSKIKSVGVSSVTTADLKARAQSREGRKSSTASLKGIADTVAAVASGEKGQLKRGISVQPAKIGETTKTSTKGSGDISGESDQSVEFGSDPSMVTIDTPKEKNPAQVSKVGETSVSSIISDVVDSVVSGDTRKKPAQGFPMVSGISSKLLSLSKSVISKGGPSASTPKLSPVKMIEKKYFKVGGQMASAKTRSDGAAQKMLAKKIDSHPSRPMSTGDSSTVVAESVSSAGVLVAVPNGSQSESSADFNDFIPMNFSDDSDDQDDSIDETNSASASGPTFDDISDFYFAIERLDADTVKWLLELHGPRHLQLHRLSASGSSLLMFAARRVDNEAHGLCEIIDVLVRYGLDMDYQNIHGETALILLCKYGSPCCVIKLLQHQPRLDLVDQSMETALFAAVKRNDLPIFRALLTHGACASIRNKQDVRILRLIKEKLPDTVDAYKFLANFTKAMTDVFHDTVDAELQKVSSHQEGATTTSLDFNKTLVQLTWFSSYNRKDVVEIPFNLDKEKIRGMRGALLFMCIGVISPAENDQNVVKVTHKNDANLKKVIRKVLLNGEELLDITKGDGDKLTFAMGQSFYRGNVLEIQFDEQLDLGEVLMVRANGFQLKVENGEGFVVNDENAMDFVDSGPGESFTNDAGAMDAAGCSAQENGVEFVESDAQESGMAGPGAQGDVPEIGDFDFQQNAMELDVFDLQHDIFDISDSDDESDQAPSHMM